MSQEEELIELSNVYHGTREYIEELEAGMRDCNTKIGQLEALASDAMLMNNRLYGQIESFEARKPFIDPMKELLQRATEALGGSNATIDQSKPSQ